MADGPTNTDDPTDRSAAEDAGDPVASSDDLDVGYADALAELESILSELEADTIDVDRLATQVRRASQLIRVCRGRIRDARIEVEQIVAELEDDH